MEIIDLKDYITDDKNSSSDFIYYDLLKDKVYPFELTDKWSYSIVKDKKGDIIFNESYQSLKMFDEESFYNLYCRLFNPIELKVTCLLGAKKKYNERNELLYNFAAMIKSIDDSSYGTIFEEISYREIEIIRQQFFEYIDNKKIINNQEFIDFGLSLSGQNNSY